LKVWGYGVVRGIVLVLLINGWFDRHGTYCVSLIQVLHAIMVMARKVDGIRHI
jgi:hypothetical protein